MTAPDPGTIRSTVVSMEFMLTVVAFFIGAGIGFFIAALMATSAHDEECARCWNRTMRNVQPKDYEG